MGWTIVAVTLMLTITGIRQYPHQYPLPDGSTNHLHEEACPLQAEIEQQHRVLHTHIFKEVVSPHQTGVNRLMV